MDLDDRKYVQTFTVNGKQVDVDLFDVTGLEWRAMKEASGYGRVELTRGLDEGEFDCIAAFVWMLARRDGEDLVYTDVLGGMTVRSLVPVAVTDETSEESEVEQTPPD